MNRLSLIDPAEDPRWDTFVERHAFGQIYHLSGWKRVLENSFRHIRGYYYISTDPGGNTIEAALPVFCVKSWLTGNRLVSAPFATLFDPLATHASQIEPLLSEVRDLSSSLKCPTIEIRTLQAAPLITDHTFGESRFFKHHYLPLDSHPDDIQRAFHRTCVRQRIAKALRSELRLTTATHELDLMDFYRLLTITRKRNSLPLQPYRFIKSLWDVFSPTGHLTILLAKNNGLSVAAVMLLMFKDRVSVEFAVSDETFRYLSTIHFLYWKAIMLSYERGYKIFDLGRTSPENLALMKFKERWGTQVVDLPHFYYPASEAASAYRRGEDWRHRMIKKIIAANPPGIINRLLGKFCYRHLG